MPKGSPFGTNLRALVIYLRFTQGVAFERLATLLSDLLGLDISEGALVNMLDASREASHETRSGSICCLGPPCSPTRRGCGWARKTGGCGCSTTRTALSSSRSRRGPRPWLRSSLATSGPIIGCRIAMAGSGLRPQWRTSGLAISARCAICIDAGDDVFAPDLRHLLGRACRIGRRRERLADATLKIYAARLDARLDQLMTRQPTPETGIKLQRMIKRTRRYLFVFVTNRDLPATNNGSERALRPCAVFRKITNGFRTEWGRGLTPTYAPSSKPPAAAPSAFLDSHPSYPRRETAAGRGLKIGG